MSLNEVNWQKVFSDNDSFPPDLVIIVQTSDTSCSIQRYGRLIQTFEAGKDLCSMNQFLQAKVCLSQAPPLCGQPIFLLPTIQEQRRVDGVQRHQPRGLPEGDRLHLPQAALQSAQRRPWLEFLLHQAGS